MKGNYHVRFLGEGEVATLRPYPTTPEASASGSSTELDPKNIRSDGHLAGDEEVTTGTPTSRLYPQPAVPYTQGRHNENRH